jgi:hypothetical protein
MGGEKIWFLTREFETVTRQEAGSGKVKINEHVLSELRFLLNEY